MSRVGYVFLFFLLVADQLAATIALQDISRGATHGDHKLCKVFAGVLVSGAVIPSLQFRSLGSLFWGAMIGLVAIVVPVVTVLYKVGTDHDQMTVAGCQLFASNGFVDETSAVFSFVVAYTGQVLYVEFMREMRAVSDFRKVRPFFHCRVPC